MVLRETNIEATPIDNATNYSIKANILKPNMVGKIVEGNLANEATRIEAESANIVTYEENITEDSEQS